jgi:hypothetical protein
MEGCTNEIEGFIKLNFYGNYFSIFLLNKLVTKQKYFYE